MVSSRPMAGLKKRDTIRIRDEPLPGVLHVRPGAVRGVSRYWPSSDLEQFVEHFWIVRWDVPEARVAETLPHPCVHLVLEEAASEVGGPMRARFTRVLVGQGRAGGTRFRPAGLRPFVTTPAAALTDRRLPLTKIFGAPAGELERLALRYKDDRKSVRVVEEFLRTVRPVANDAMALATRIAERIARERGI